MTPAPLILLDRVRRVTERLGIKLIMQGSEYLDGGNFVGYFDDDKRELAVALGRGDWLYTLAHEYCHMLQWAEDLFGADTNKACDLFEKWMDGKLEADPANVRQWVQEIVACELDCERRTVSLLTEEGLLQDRSDYIRKANVYAYQYELAARTRKWVKGFTVDPEAVKLVTDQFIEPARVEQVPPALEDLYRWNAQRP